MVGRRLLYRDLCVDPADLLRIGGVLVTSAERTLADLSRISDEDYAVAAWMMADADPGLAARTVSWLEAHGALPHKRSALVVLRALAARKVARQEDVTR